MNSVSYWWQYRERSRDWSRHAGSAAPSPKRSVSPSLFQSPKREATRTWSASSLTSQRECRRFLRKTKFQHWHSLLPRVLLPGWWKHPRGQKRAGHQEECSSALAKRSRREASLKWRPTLGDHIFLTWSKPFKHRPREQAKSISGQWQAPLSRISSFLSVFVWSICKALLDVLHRCSHSGNVSEHIFQSPRTATRNSDCIIFLHTVRFYWSDSYELLLA